VGAGATDAWADGGAADSAPPACDDDELHPTPRLAPTSCPLIEILGEDELALIVASVRVDDELAVALTCRALHTAALGARQAQAPFPGCDFVSKARPGTWPRKHSTSLPFQTSALSLASSMSRLSWGLACGAPLSLELASVAAYRGDVAMLERLRALGCLSEYTEFSYCGPVAALNGHLHVLKWMQPTATRQTERRRTSRPWAGTCTCSSGRTWLRCGPGMGQSRQ
jgi:hypothetical protein